MKINTRNKIKYIIKIRKLNNYQRWLYINIDKGYIYNFWGVYVFFIEFFIIFFYNSKDVYIGIS